MTPRTRNLLKLAGIGMVAIAPIVGSYLLYYFWLPSRHTNYGTLVSPRPLPTASMRLADGTEFSLSRLRGHWTLVAVDAGGCGPDCEKKLWKIRQVRRTQGKEMGRVERVWLIDDGQTPAARMVSEHEGMWFVTGGTDAAVRALPAPKSPRDHIYLVDPLGNVMLRFPPHAEPKGMVKDITRLLKYSRVG